jgi:PmbA protein
VTGPPLSHAQLREVSGPALDVAGSDGVEIVFTGSRVGLTRYANSQIIQNTVQTSLHAHVRVVVGRRFAVASTNRFDAASLRNAAVQGVEAAQHSADDPEFPGLPDPGEVGTAAAELRFDESTAVAAPQQRADRAAEIIKAAGDCSAAGIYETSSHAYAVISSTGIDCFDAYTRCVVNVVAELNGTTAYGEASSDRASAIDVEGIALKAAATAKRSGRSTHIGPGHYDVVLEPAAVAVLLDYLAYTGMGAKQVIDGESFLSSRIGAVVAGDSVTVGDDVHHPLSVGIGFDFEGVPKREVAVIDGGRAIRPVTDLRTSRILDVPLSGHYSGSNEFGPYPSNVVMQPGESSLEELIAAVDDGLLIGRLHYVNVLDRPSTLLTGMTRDGIWRIRGGEVTTHANNLRFTQSVLDALLSTAGVGRDLEAFAPDYGGFGSNVAPALRCTDFSFTSTTSH